MDGRCNLQPPGVWDQRLGHASAVTAPPEIGHDIGLGLEDGLGGSGTSVPGGDTIPHGSCED